MGLIDKTKAEKAALQLASQRAGEYLETLPSADMARMTFDQWKTFIEVTVAGFVEGMKEQASKEAPF